MIIAKPAYYDSFRCIASACPDSCCKEWDVQVDDTAAEFYQSLPGALGDRLRQVLRREEDEWVMTIEDGRCPMWRTDGLCRIQAELGEEALCHVCREFPRLRHDYGDFAELGLELSCPEAARIIFTGDHRFIEEKIPGGEEPEYDPLDMACLKDSRAQALALLEGNPAQALTKLLCFGYQAQEALDCGEAETFDGAAALESARELAGAWEQEAFLQAFRDLEILTDSWAERLAHPDPVPMDEKTLIFARYLVNRYWLQAVSDLDLVSRVKFTVVSCLLVNLLGGDFVATAQLFSKEIENDAENVDALLEGAYTCPAFTDRALLGMLLEGWGK